MTIARALIVGIADYRSVPSLPRAVRHDVADIVTLLSDPAIGGLDRDAITLLADDAATLGGIREAFRDAISAVPADGTFLFYFSGHGERAVVGGKERSWLLPHDAELANLAASALSSDEITGFLNAIEADRQVLIIDACHAGGIGSMKSAAESPNGFGKSGADELARGAGRVLLTSSRHDELSAILIGDRNSVFTTALLEALNGATHDRGDGMVGVMDVFQYVSSEVPKRVDDQHPVLHAESLETNIPIARRRAEVLRVSYDTNDLVGIFAGLYPAGPRQDEIWIRAGGNISLLHLSGTGVAQWFSALEKMRLGGGGLTLEQLVRSAAEDYPDNVALNQLGGALPIGE